jgi:hypothetical protein
VPDSVLTTLGRTLTRTRATKLPPRKGSTVRGTRVRITGTGFAGVSVVSFGSTKATEVTYNSPQSLTRIVRAGAWEGERDRYHAQRHELAIGKGQDHFKAPKGK